MVDSNQSKLPEDHIHVIGHYHTNVVNFDRPWVSLVDTKGKQLLAIIDHNYTSMDMMMRMGQACADILKKGE